MAPTRALPRGSLETQGTAPYDFVVIGSGFGGSVSAFRLAEKGYRVAVLEAGRRYRPPDFPRTSWNLRRFLWVPALRCFGILRMTLLRDSLVLSGAGVGGGSLVYAATLLEPPDAFYDDPHWSDMPNWRAALAPHFATARRMLGVATNPRETPSDRVVLACADELGVADSYRLQDVGIHFGEPGVRGADPYFGGQGPEREGCRFCGGCIVGCRHGAKNSLDLNYLHLAESLGVDVFPETKAISIRETPGGGHAVETRSTTALLPRRGRTFHAARVVVAAGVLGTLDLLFRCRVDETLPRISHRLGRAVRTNSESIVGATARGGAEDYSQGIAISSSVHLDEDTHVEPVRYPGGSDAMALLATLLTEGRSRGARLRRWARQILARPGDFARTLWPFGWARRTIVLLAMQTADNRFRIVRRRRRLRPWSWRLDSVPDSEGAPVPSYIPGAHDFARRVARRIGGFPVSSIHEVLLNVPVTAHLLGGCVIGPDPSRGVVDARLRLHGHPDILVVDGSVVPANPGVNPSLTITALAEHAMAHVPPKSTTAAAQAQATTRRRASPEIDPRRAPAGVRTAEGSARAPSTTTDRGTADSPGSSR